MKKSIPIRLIFTLLFIGIYLNRSYAYFYNYIGQNHLSPPHHEINTTINQGFKNKLITYVALGDSLTEGVGASDYKYALPYLIAQKLSSENNVELINLAHAGDTSLDILVNQLPKALSLKPDLITILIGVNDIHNQKSLSEFESNYIQIVERLKKDNTKIYLLAIPYLGSNKITYFPYNIILNFRTKQFNNIIKRISENARVEYIDLYSTNKSTNFYSSDQFHPSDQGYEDLVKSINVN